MSKIYTSADQLIGHTPLLELTHIENAENLEAKILAKLEYFNPAGSVKDRIAKAMIAGISAPSPARDRRRRPPMSVQGISIASMGNALRSSARHHLSSRTPWSP